jgi:hypothetical protein
MIIGSSSTAVRLRINNTIAKPGLEYCSEPWTLREPDKRRMEASETRFLLAPVGISLRPEIRGTDIRKRLRTARTAEELQEYQGKWHNHVEGMPPERQPRQAILITLLEDGTLDIQGEYGHIRPKYVVNIQRVVCLYHELCRRKQ